MVDVIREFNAILFYLAVAVRNMAQMIQRNPERAEVINLD